MQFSPDGEWYWDGSQWRPAFSPDGRWRWDGTGWRPAVPPEPAWRYEPTAWTRRLQVLVLVLMALGLVATALLEAAFLPSMLQQSIDSSLAAQPQNPDVDVAQLRAVMTQVIYGSLIVAAVLGVVLYGVVVVGVLRLWRWVYWYLAVSYMLGLLGLPTDFLYAFGRGPVRMPAAVLLLQVPLALAHAALGVWMIVLYTRYGTWARRRVPLDN